MDMSTWQRSFRTWAQRQACAAAMVGAGLFAVACGLPPTEATIPTEARTQAVCLPGDGGGSPGCACSLNAQCAGHDEDTRLVVCDVPPGAMLGKCLSCTATSTMRPVGCACTTNSECATGLACNGRTCQALRSRGEYCFRDSDCGSDPLGTLRCLPTKSWCGPLEGDFYCDFNSDCLSGRCVAGACTPGGVEGPCMMDSDCKMGLLCSKIYSRCMEKQPDGKPCARNVECQNQCNSVSGICLLGKNGVLCSMSNPDGDCQTGFSCTDCGGTYTCRVPGGPCG